MTTYKVKNIKHVEIQKEDEDEEYWATKLTDETARESISIKGDLPPKFKVGDKLNFEVKSRQLALVEEKA